MITSSFAPRTGVIVASAEQTTPDEVAAIVTRAAAAAGRVADASPAERRTWLDALADAAEAHHDELVALADEETALGTARLSSEVKRMADQLRLISALTAGSRLLEECFGPVALVVEYADDTELEAGIRTLQGSLAAAVFGGDDDPDVSRYVALLAGQAGRVTVGDWPTGVAWTWAQQHGGPWPATSSPATTSVGAADLSRFVRPVTFQSVPDAALPSTERAAAAPGNPWRIPRRIDGELVVP